MNDMVVPDNGRFHVECTLLFNKKRFVFIKLFNIVVILLKLEIIDCRVSFVLLCVSQSLIMFAHIGNNDLSFLLRTAASCQFFRLLNKLKLQVVDFRLY